MNRIKKFKCLFFNVFVLFALFNPLQSWADESCLPYSSAGELNVAMQEAQASVVDKAKKVLSSYIAAAKKNDVEKVNASFTKLDGSYAHARKMSSGSPDLYEGFKGIKQFEIDSAFQWGKYVVMWVDYAHTRGNAKILETVLCTNLCQMSNIFERPEAGESHVSRYMSLMREVGGGVQCPASAPNFEIAPSNRIANESLMKVYFKSNFIGKAFSEIYSENALSLKGRNISECRTILQGTDDDLGLTEDDWVTLIDKFISKCTVNMTNRKVTPVVEVNDDGGRSKYLTPMTLMSVLNKIEKLLLAFSFKDGEVTANVYHMQLSDGRKMVFLSPLRKINDVVLLDWSYYGSAAGEMISSSEFSGFVKEKVGSIK